MRISLLNISQHGWNIGWACIQSLWPFRFHLCYFIRPKAILFLDFRGIFSHPLLFHPWNKIRKICLIAKLGSICQHSSRQARHNQFTASFVYNFDAFSCANPLNYASASKMNQKRIMKIKIKCQLMHFETKRLSDLTRLAKSQLDLKNKFIFYKSILRVMSVRFRDVCCWHSCGSTN